jgi:hypothetical protein
MSSLQTDLWSENQWDEKIWEKGENIEMHVKYFSRIQNGFDWMTIGSRNDLFSAR